MAICLRTFSHKIIPINGIVTTINHSNRLSRKIPVRTQFLEDVSILSLVLITISLYLCFIIYLSISMSILRLTPRNRHVTLPILQHRGWPRVKRNLRYFCYFQFFSKRRISSCRAAPKCSTESNIDDVYVHEVAIANSYLTRKSNDKSKLTIIDNVDTNEVIDNIENYSNYCTDGMKILSLTSDDYIERRNSYKLHDIPSISMNDVDFSKCNEVNIFLKC